MFKLKPNWILIDGDNGPKAPLPAAELAKYLEQRDPTDDAQKKTDWT